MGKTIQEIIDQMEDYMNISTTLAHSSKRKYSKIIRLFLLSNGLEFNLEDVNRFITERNKTKNCYNYKYAFKYFLESIGHKEIYEKLRSTKKKPRKKVFKYISEEIMQKIINRLPSKYRYMALFQLKTGTRFIEMATLRAENIDFNKDPDLIFIALGAGLSKTKGSKGRTTMIQMRYEHIMRGLMKRPFGYVFLDPKCEHFDEERLMTHLDTIKRYYNNELQLAGEYNGVEGLSSQYLRHLFADYYLLKGGTIESLKEMMGHSKIETTLGYVSVSKAIALKTMKLM